MNNLSIILPAYRENPAVVEGLYFHLTQLGCEVIVVDDGGYMELSIPHHKIPHKGYGYALKYGILQAKNKVVCTMDSDFQHQPKDVEILYNVFKQRDDIAMVVGVRWSIKDSPIRWVFRKCINFLASIISSHYHQDLNSGMRIFNRKIVLDYRDILCDTFSFTTSITMAMTTDGYKIAYFPIDVLPRKHGKSTVKLFKDGFITLYYVVWIGLGLRTRKIRKTFRAYFSFFRKNGVLNDVDN